MKTSVSQFLILVDSMERDGDLNKPAEGPYGRLNNINKWADLTRVLNMDLTGEGKSIEKWKKVWSDLKNNTKRKAAKIHKATVGTGGGPPTKLFLSDLELRVLNIIGSQSATGLIEVDEVGAMSPVPAASPTPADSAPFTSEPRVAMIHIETSPSVYDSTESSNHPLPYNPHTYIPHPSTPSIPHTYIPHPSTPSIPHTYIPHPSTPSIPHPSTLSIPPTPSIPRPSTLSIPPTPSIPRPSTLPIPPTPSIPRPSSTTPHSSRSRPTVRRRSASRRSAPRTSRVDAATRQFQTSDECWRNLISEIASENQQLRHREVEQQAQWQFLFTRLMDIAENYLNK